MENVFAALGCSDGSHWGITDLYPEYEQTLREALLSGRDFTASWGSKKEIHYATVTRENGAVYVAFSCQIDELYDLVDTLIWAATGRKYSSGYDYICQFHELDPSKPGDEEKAEGIMQEVQSWVEDDYQEDFRAFATLSANAPYEQIMEKLGELGDVAVNESQAKYEELVEIVKEGIDASLERNQPPWS